MGSVRHIAIASQEPEKLADFSKAASGWQEVSRLDILRCREIVLSDGAMNISVLQFKRDQIGRGLEFTGHHHMGIYVDDMAEAEEKGLALGAIPYDGVAGGQERGELPAAPVGQVQGPGRQSIRHQRRAVDRRRAGEGNRRIGAIIRLGWVRMISIRVLPSPESRKHGCRPVVVDLD